MKKKLAKNPGDAGPAKRKPGEVEYFYICGIKHKVPKPGKKKKSTVKKRNLSG